MNNRHTERREIRLQEKLKIENEEEYKREKRKNFYNAYLELKSAQRVLQRINILFISQDYDISKIRKQIVDMKENEVLNLNKNINLDKTDLLIAGEMNYINNLRNNLSLVLDLFSKYHDKSFLKETVVFADKQLNSIIKKVEKHLREIT